MKKFTFKPEDFQFDVETLGRGITGKDICEAANKRLVEMLADAPTVFANPMHNNLWLELLPGHIDNLSIGHTHTAKIVCIEEIKHESK